MPRLALPLALALALALPAVGAAVTPQGVASTWRETLTINTATARPAKMFEAFDTASLNLFDFNGDGQLEIVSNNDNNRAYVLDSRTGAVLAELPTTHPGGETWPVRDINAISIGELMGDGRPCMLVPSDAAHITAWCYNAAASTPLRFNFTKEWDVYVDAEKFEPDFKEKHPWLYYPDNGTPKDTGGRGMDGAVYMASVDKTGCKYVFAETDGFPGQFAFDCHGQYKWSVSFYDGNAGAKVIDLNGDGSKDACFATDAGEVACYDARTGRIEWTFRAREHGAYPGSIPLAPTFADVYGNGKMYAFFGARNAVYNATATMPPSNKNPTYNANWMNETHAVWYLVDNAGRMLWNASYDWMNPVQYNHPAAFDVNHDGVLDMVALDWNTIGHKPGDWEPTNRASNLFALDGRDGSLLWRTSVGIYWSNKDFVIADADGDGKMDVILNDPRLGNEGLGVFDAHTGKNKGWFPFADGWGVTRGPVAGDLYGDGQLYLVVPAAHRLAQPNYRSLDVGYREGELHVVATGLRYNVAFSANFLLSDDQKETQVHGTNGGTPPPPTPTPTPTPTPSTPTPPTPTAPTPPANNTTTTTTTSTTPPTGSTTTSTVTTTTTTPGTTPPTEAVPPSRVPAPGVLALVLAAGVALLAIRRR